MSAIPRARVLREGEGGNGRPKPGGETAPDGHVLRLAPRALPRAVIWRLIWAPLGIVSCWFAAIMMFFLASWLILLISGSRDVWPSAAVVSQLFYISVLSAICLSLFMGLISLPWWIRDLQLLRYGVVTHGTLVQKLEKSVAFSCPMTGAPGTQMLTELTFQYEIGGTTYTVTVRRAPESRLSRLDLGARVATLVDPRKPSNETTPDLDGPGWLEITASGELRVRSGTSLHLWIVPVAFVSQLVATAI
jgi:hypothetical protein